MDTKTVSMLVYILMKNNEIDMFEATDAACEILEVNLALNERVEVYLELV